MIRDRVVAGLRAHPGLVKIIGWVLLVVGLGASWRASGRMGIDDFPTLRMMAEGIVQGVPVYVTDWQKGAFSTGYGVGAPPGMFYPPATGFALFPLALLPRRVGEFLWFCTLAGAVVLGVRALVRHVASQGATQSGDEWWPVIAGLVLLSATIRWGMTPLQGAPLMFGLLCFLVVSLHTDRPRLAFAIVFFATAFKITLALPFLGLLVLHRRYAAAGASLVGWGVLNVLGFERMGAGSFHAYQQNMAVVEALGDINTPNPWDAISIPRCDWVYLLYGLSGSQIVSRILALLLSAAVGIWLLREWTRLSAGRSAPSSAPRSRPDLTTTAAFLGPLVCLGSLAVYHHHYDLSLLLVPFLIACLGEPALRSPHRGLWMALPLTLMLALLPVGAAPRLLVRVFDSRAVGWFHLTFPIATSLALAGALVVLAQVVRRSPEPLQLDREARGD